MSGAARVLAPALALWALVCASGCPGPAGGGGPSPSPSPSAGVSPSEGAQVSPSASLAPLTSAARGARRRIALFIPHDDLFWRDFRGFMRAATAQLGMDLEVHLAANNRELMKDQLRRATSGPAPVDAVVFQNFKECAGDLLEIADAAGVPSFLVNAGVSEAERGLPRQRHPRWIGSMLPDDVRAGRLLGDLLIDEAQRRGLVDAAGKVQLVGLAGFVSDASSRDRIEGLEAALAARQDAVLHQVVPTDWGREAGAGKAKALLRRFPAAAVVWTASDALALGAMDALSALGRQPGSDSLVGGIDWSPEGLEAVRSGGLYVTVGGHFMEGGWVAVLLHDYFAGRDFAGQGVVFQTPMRAITQAEVERFHAQIVAAEWTRIDFRRLSSAGRDPGYAFDPVEVLTGLGR